MAKFLFACFVCFVAAHVAFAAENIIGLWLIDKNRPQGIVMLYMHDGLLYGRMIATYGDDGKNINDTIATRTDKADKLRGAPPMCGLDFVYQVKDTGREWQGLIMNPDNGDEYTCRLWRDNDNLIVRGQLKGLLGFLGGNQTWVPFDERALPTGLKLPNSATVVPVVPVKK